MGDGFKKSNINIWRALHCTWHIESKQSPSRVLTREVNVRTYFEIGHKC